MEQKGRGSRVAQRPHRGQARDGLASVQVFAARITDVDPVSWTCIVRAELFDKVFRDVAIGSLYLHPFDGEGVHVMPEPGAPVWVARSSEGDLRPFILGYRPYYQKDTTSAAYPRGVGARANRPTMVPGDIFLQTRDRNGLRVRRGGVTEIFGGPLARTVYQSRDGRVQTLFQNLQMEGVPGSLRWTTETPEKHNRGKQLTHLEFRSKEFSNDRGHVVQVETGGGLSTPSAGTADGAAGVFGAAPASAELVSVPVLRLRVFQDGDKADESLAEAVSVLADKDGQLEVMQTGELRLGVRGTADVTLTATPAGALALSADTSVDVETAGAVRVSGASVSLETPGLAVVNDGATLSVGASTAGVLYDNQFGTMLSAALAELKAALNSLGLPTTETDKLLLALSRGDFTSDKLRT